MLKNVSKYISVALASALAMAAPGPSCYEAMAQGLASSAGTGRSQVSDPIAALGAISAPTQGAASNLVGDLGRLSPSAPENPALESQVLPLARELSSPALPQAESDGGGETRNARLSAGTLLTGPTLQSAGKAVYKLDRTVANSGLLNSKMAGSAAGEFFDRSVEQRGENAISPAVSEESDISRRGGVLPWGSLPAAAAGVLAVGSPVMAASSSISHGAVSVAAAIVGTVGAYLLGRKAWAPLRDAASRWLSGKQSGAPAGRGPPLLRAPLWLGGILAIVGGLYLYPSALFALGHYLRSGMAQGLEEAAKAYAEGNPGLALLGLLYFPAYILSNTAGFLFPISQVWRILVNRSTNVSIAKLGTGSVSSKILSVAFFFSGNFLAAYQNLFGGFIFDFIIGLKFWYRRPSAPDNSWNSVANKVFFGSILVAGATFALGQGLAVGIPMIPMGAFIVPLQMLAALGFSYLMLPEYLKIEREKSVGDASLGMAWMYLICISMAGTWMLHELAKIPANPMSASLTALTMMLTAVAPWTLMTLRWLSQRQWGWLSSKLGPERGADLGSFLILGALMVGMVGIGHYALQSLLSIPASSVLFLPYLFYLTGNVVTDVITALNIAAFYKYSKKSGREKSK